MQPKTRSALLPLALAAAWVTPATAALAQTVPPDYGHDFVTIGNPGNRGASPVEAPRWREDLYGPLGAVGYEYRITRTEVTNAQYVRFLDAYFAAPGAMVDPRALGGGMYIDRFGPGGRPIIEFYPGAEHAPADPSFYYAARYANWLHNGMGGELEDFERGVYDTSTFGRDPVTGERTDQIARSPGATFFLPTVHEWRKAVYYDPDRYGEGEEGYWRYPNTSDEPLVTGLPGEPGAETSANLQWDHPEIERLAVGLYPQSAGPWGLLDASGGAAEIFETIAGSSRTRLGTISSLGLGDPAGDDLLDRGFTLFPEGRVGFRIASVVPGPGVGTVLVLAGFGMSIQRRRK